MFQCLLKDVQTKNFKKSSVIKISKFFCQHPITMKTTKKLRPGKLSAYHTSADSLKTPSNSWEIITDDGTWKRTHYVVFQRDDADDDEQKKEYMLNIIQSWKKEELWSRWKFNIDHLPFTPLFIGEFIIMPAYYMMMIFFYFCRWCESVFIYRLRKKKRSECYLMCKGLREVTN